MRFRATVRSTDKISRSLGCSLSKFCPAILSGCFIAEKLAASNVLTDSLTGDSRWRFSWQLNIHVAAKFSWQETGFSYNWTKIFPTTFKWNVDLKIRTKIWKFSSLTSSTYQSFTLIMIFIPDFIPETDCFLNGLKLVTLLQTEPF